MIKQVFYCSYTCAFCQFVATEISPLYRITFVQNILCKSVINKRLANAVHYIYAILISGRGEKKEKVKFLKPACSSELSMGPECSKPFHLGRLLQDWAKECY